VRAWGAYNAGERNETQYESLIVPLLNECDARVQSVALDALIRLRADVPEDSLRGLVETRQIDPIVVLYTNHPRPHSEFLMQLLDGLLTEPQRLALNALLASSPPPGFAARLLAHWTIRYVVTVHDGTPFIGAGTWVGVGSGSSRGPRVDEPGFPPVYVYRLEPYPPGKNSVPLLKEPFPIYYVREQSRTYPVRDPLYAEQDGDRLGYLGFIAHLNASERSSLLPTAPMLKWDGVAKYQADAEQFLNAVRTSVQALKEKLIAAGALTQQESRAGPKLEVIVHDERGNRSIPLPAFDWRL
jgi:hypothetical protein